MKEVFALLLGLFALALWREVMRWDCAQNFVHRLGKPFNRILQWHYLFFIGLTVLMVQNMVEVVWYNYYKLDWLNPARVQETYSEKGIPPDTAAQLEIPEWLRRISVAGPIVGSVAFLGIIAQVIRNVLRVKGVAKDRFKQSQEGGSAREAGDYLKRDESSLADISDGAYWRPTKRQDMVLLVIAMPAVFIVMSVRSTQRMWMIMRASDTGKMERIDLALFTENLELASVCQYYIVFVFSQLCMVFIKKEESSKEIQWAMQFAGFQGVYAWVIVGTFRCIFDFGVALLGAHEDFFGIDSAKLQEKSVLVEEKVSTVFSVLTLMCVYNMAIICKLKYVKDNLGNASMKFLGTRFLLLVGQMQLQIIMRISAAREQLPFLPDLSEFRVRLLHSSLMSIECLIVVLFNWYAWEIDVKSDLYEPLLGK